MAETDPTPNPQRVTLRITEVQCLADRLWARGRTRLLDIPEQQRDLRLAAKALRVLLRSFNPHDVLVIENGV
jgi:hypothetical protein